MLRISQAPPRISLIGVDDDFAQYAIALLATRGLRVEVTVPHEGDGIQRLCGSSAAIVLDLDTCIGRMHVVELLRQIRDRHFDTPVLVLTTSTDARLADTAFAMGASDVRTKPCRGLMFANAIMNLLRFGPVLPRLGGICRAWSDSQRKDLTHHTSAEANTLDILTGYNRRVVNEYLWALGDVRPPDFLSNSPVGPTILEVTFRVFISGELCPPLMLNIGEILRQLLVPACGSNGATKAREATAMIHDTLARLQSDWPTRVTRALLILAEGGPKQREVEIGSRLGVHPSAIGRAVKAHTGVSLCQWRWALTARTAVHEVISSDHPIKEVAYNCGVLSTDALDHVFTRLCGLTPTEVRVLATDGIRSQSSRSWQGRRRL